LAIYIVSVYSNPLIILGIIRELPHLPLLDMVDYHLFPLLVPPYLYYRRYYGLKSSGIFCGGEHESKYERTGFFGWFHEI